MMRTSGTGRTRTLATLLVLLGLLAGTAPCQRSVIPIDQPSYLQIEVLEVGGNQDYASLRALKLTFHSGQGFRAGISAADGGTRVFEEYGGWTAAPIHVGYDIVFNPKKTAFFFGMVPSCYVEATLGAFPAYAKLAAACDIDYIGVGAGIEVGVFDWSPTAPLRDVQPQLYTELKLRLLDAAFRLPGRR